MIVYDSNQKSSKHMRVSVKPGLWNVLYWTGLIHYVSMRIVSVGGPLFFSRDQERVFCLYFVSVLYIPMDIIIISSRELTGNLHKPLILVSYQVGI